MGGIVRKRKSVVIKANGTQDHIHLVVRLHQDVALTSLVRDLKAASSSWMKRIEPDFKWQAGYGGFSCSISQLDRLKGYVANQKHHHMHKSTDEEMRDLAKKWGFQWMWDPVSLTQVWQPD